jgi:hypothetical protein
MPAPRRGLTTVWHLLLGAGLALAAWDGVGHLRANSLQQLVFAPGPNAGAVTALSDRWTVALLFTPNECPGLMVAVDRLNELAGTRAAVQGILLVDQKAFPGWQQLIVANQIHFPVAAVSVDRGTRALAQVGNLSTPTVAIFDPDRRLRLATNLTGEEALATLIARTLQASNRDRPSAGSAP